MTRPAPPSVAAEIAALRALPVAELRAAWRELFGVATRNPNKDYLWRRLAFRLQERAEGGLSERARARLEALLREPASRAPPPSARTAADALRDPRLPPAGTVLARTYGGAEHRVTLLDDGVEYRGARFASLSAVARAITGTRWNGFRFFGLDEAGGSR